MTYFSGNAFAHTEDAHKGKYSRYFALYNKNGALFDIFKERTLYTFRLVPAFSTNILFLFQCRNRLSLVCHSLNMFYSK